jgi:ankyrin repeat protein
MTLLLRAGGRTSLRDSEDRTALMCAAENASADAARVLVPSCSGSDRSEALRVATKHASLPMVKLLLAAGADPVETAPDGTSALSLAWASKKVPGIVKLLAKAASKATSTRAAS